MKTEIQQVAEVVVSGSDAIGNATNPAELYDAVSSLAHALSLQLSTLKMAKSNYNRRRNTSAKPAPATGVIEADFEVAGMKIENIEL